MPNQIHSAPRATSHHEAADASRAPCRIVLRSRSGVFTSLVIAILLWDAAQVRRQPLPACLGANVERRTGTSWPPA